MMNRCDNILDAHAMMAKRLANRLKREEALKEEDEFIYVKVRKKDFPGIESTPPVLKKPLSDKQLATRMKFGMASQFLNQVKTFIDWSHANPKKDSRGAITSHLLKNCFAGEYPDLRIDYSKVLLGRKGSVSHVRMGFVALPKCKVYAHWDFFGNASGDDEVYLVLYNIDQKKFSWSKPISRDAECVLAEFNDAKPNERFVLYSFVKSEAKNCANRYLGEGVFV